MINFNLAFYTCFYGDNDNAAFRIPELPSLKYKCYYYTNNKTIIENLKNTNWISIYDDKPIIKDSLTENCMIGKHIKVMPQEYQELKDYDYLCFLDSKLEKVNEIFVENFIVKYFIEQNYALLLRKHWFVNNNVWDEYNESMHQERYKIDSEKYKNYITNQIKNGFSETTEYHCACGFLIRNMKHNKTIEINKMWYQHIQECGIQDQISFFFIKQSFNEYILPFTEIPFVQHTNTEPFTEIPFVQHKNKMCSILIIYSLLSIAYLFIINDKFIISNSLIILLLNVIIFFLN